MDSYYMFHGTTIKPKRFRSKNAVGNLTQYVKKVKDSLVAITCMILCSLSSVLFKLTFYYSYSVISFIIIFFSILESRIK